MTVIVLFWCCFQTSLAITRQTISALVRQQTRIWNWSCLRFYKAFPLVLFSIRTRFIGTGYSLLSEEPKETVIIRYLLSSKPQSINSHEGSPYKAGNKCYVQFFTQKYHCCTHFGSYVSYHTHQATNVFEQSDIITHLKTQSLTNKQKVVLYNRIQLTWGKTLAEHYKHHSTPGRNADIKL